MLNSERHYALASHVVISAALYCRRLPLRLCTNPLTLCKTCLIYSGAAEPELRPRSFNSERRLAPITGLELRRLASRRPSSRCLSRWPGTATLLAGGTENLSMVSCCGLRGRAGGRPLPTATAAAADLGFNPLAL
uniref:Uncharacterized protein n=1 Tax=Macrostomum lignano TaxID=282301 RepID=A0A1I8FBK1_9PLAT